MPTATAAAAGHPIPGRVITCGTPEETRAFGAAIGRCAEPGAVVLLQGDLGAGKTVVAQGVGRGLGVPSTVNSPTFVLINEHLGGRLPLRHADLYRLDDPISIAELGLDEAAQGGVLLVEWPERAGEALPADHLLVRLAPQGGDAGEAAPRRIELTARGPASETLLAALGGG